MFSTYQCLEKGVWVFFLFCLDLELFAKIKKRPGFYTLVFYIFINNSRSKNPEHSFADIVKYETCAKFQQKILNFVVVGARQSFQFFSFQINNLVSWK